MLGLCLVAAFAVAAYVATSASALPEFGQCTAKEGGKYTNAGCTAKASLKHPGSFEWKKASEIEATKRHFVGAGTAGVLDGIYSICEPGEARAEKCKEGEEEHFFLSEPGKPLKIECESEANTGEIASANTVANVAVIFRGCKLLGTAPCSNTVNEGEIQVNELKGKVGFIKKSTAEVGLVLEPNVKKGEFAKFTCLGGQIGTVVGEGNKTEGCAYAQTHCGGDQIIGKVGPVNTETTTLTQTFVANEATAENEPSKLEGKPISLLESYVFNVENPGFSTKWSKAGESIVNVAHDCQHGDETLAECEAAPEEGELKATA